MSINGWRATNYTKSIGKARLEVWKSGDTWSAMVVDASGEFSELVAENLNTLQTLGDAMDWAETTALILVAP